MQKGMYRAYNEKLGEICARIDVGAPHVEAFLTRKAYTDNGYLPLFDELPTKEDYVPQSDGG